jgi:hypothetical protein
MERAIEERKQYQKLTELQESDMQSAVLTQRLFLLEN